MTLANRNGKFCKTLAEEDRSLILGAVVVIWLARMLKKA